MAEINFECKKCNRIFDCDTGNITFGNMLDFEKDIVCPNCGKLTKEDISLTEDGQTQISQLYFKKPVIKGHGIYENLFSEDKEINVLRDEIKNSKANEKPKEEIKKELKDFINKDTRELCEYLGFDFYLEVKTPLFLIKRQNHEDIINALFEIIGNKPVKVIKCYNEKIKKYFGMDLDKIKKNALLFEEDKGDFYDEDPYICYCLLGEDFFTCILNQMLFFYGTKESVKKMADLYDKYNIDYHEPYKLEKYEPYDYPLDDDEEEGDNEEENEESSSKLMGLSKKIGRNELCPCGSGKKYKKCCLKL